MATTGKALNRWSLGIHALYFGSKSKGAQVDADGSVGVAALLRPRRLEGRQPVVVTLSGVGVEPQGALA